MQTHDDASLRLQVSAGAVAYPMVSDPRLRHTDGDGLRDPDEEDLGTGSRRADTDGDGLSDARGGRGAVEPEVPQQRR